MFGGRPPVGGRPGARAPWALLNPALYVVPRVRGTPIVMSVLQSVCPIIYLRNHTA